MKIVYEDNHVIAVVKPHGLLVQSDASGDPCLMDEVKQYLKQTRNKPGNVFLGLVHRLDRPVSGIVIFGKTSKGASRLSEQFRSRTIEKVYEATVEGCPKKKKDEITLWLKKNSTTNIVTAFTTQTKGALQSELSYTVTDSDGKTSKVKIFPKTGRPHQIRVSMQQIGCPIVGDAKYGARLGFKNGIALSATELSFNKVVGGERIKLTL